MDNNQSPVQAQNPTQPVQPTPQPVQPAPQPMQPVPQPMQPVQPMPQQVRISAISPEPKKKKTGLIAGIIALIVVLCGGIAAAIVLLQKTGDPTADFNEGILKILDTKEFELSGKVNVESQVNFSLNLNTKINGDKQSTTLAFESGNIMGVMPMSGISANIVSEKSNLFIKTSGINEIASSLSGLKIDDNWYYADLSDYLQMINESSMTENVSEDILNCALNSKNKIIDLYKKDSFVVLEKYTGNEIAAKTGNLYTLKIDSEKLANFINNLGNQIKSDNCVDEDYELDIVTPEEVSSLIQLPTIYVEMKGKEIIRFYANISLPGAKVEFDLNISYPKNIDITMPTDYMDIEDILGGLFDYSDTEEFLDYEEYTDAFIDAGDLDHTEDIEQLIELF